MDRLNPYELKVKDVVTAKNSGIHQIVSMEEKDGSIEVGYIQLWSLEGTEFKINYTNYCDISCCKPAFMEIPNVTKRIKKLNDLLRYLNEIKGNYNVY